MKAWQTIVVVTGLLVAAASCRHEPARPKARIQKITFEEQAKTIYVGDTVKINVTAEPAEGKSNDKIEYRTSESGIIAIKEDSGNDGVVFEGLKRGATVITATANGVVDYCGVNVLGGGDNVIPHIVLPYYVAECRENERKSIVATLVGGTPLDDSGFAWANTGQRVISLEAVGNTAVFDTLSLGESVITVSHPKAQFSVDVLVYVSGNDEIPVYITTDSNVITMQATDSGYQYAVELHGGDSGDYYGFTHTVLDGNDIIELRANNNIGTVTPKAGGVARIGVSHQKAAYRMDIIVIVNEEIEYRYIDVDQTLVVMEEGYSEVLRAELAGDAPQDYIEKYGFENEDNTVITVEQSLGQFRITGLRRGRSVVKIKNAYADFDREVLVIVNGIGSIQDNEVYISTNQNVITTEAGGDDVILTMTLAGGNEADRNNFVWTVDDGSIISVESAHGRVEYKNRSAASNTGEQFEAQAVIKAKKVGTATITLENSKAKNSFSVIVKVYKKGVFGVVPVVVNGPGVYKVGLGEQLPAYLRAVTGSERNLTNITWSSENSDIVSASGTRLTGMLEGKGTGITTIRVSGDNMKHDYTATVIVGNAEYLKTIPFMYVLNPFMSVVKGGSVSFRIMCEHMSREEIAGISAVNNSGNIMEVFAYKDSVTVTGVEPGEGEIIISGSGLNTLRVTVMVEEYDINPDMPYYLRTEKFIYGLVKGRSLEIGVNLAGGSAVNEQGIIWKIEDSNVALASGNGKRCLIEGRNIGQTVIKVNHPKSINDLEIVIYVVEKEADITGKVVIYAKEQNMLLAGGETRYISIITNANDEQKKGFQWDISNSSVIDVSVSADRVKAYVLANNAGSATVTVRHNSQTVPAVIYISVINKISDKTYINVPSIVEMAAGETLSINAVTNNLFDKNNIMWALKEGAAGNIISVYGNGDTCLVTALKGGRAVIRVEYKREGFVKDIAVYVYNSVAEMAGKYIIAGEQSRYVINQGDVINASLVFGMKGYPENDLYNIWWRTGDATVIEVAGNGKTANVRGVNEGIGIITVTDKYENNIMIEVEVRKTGGAAGKYWFSVNAKDRIKGILAGSYADIEVRVFNGNDNEVFNVSGIEYVVENREIISVTPNGASIRVTAVAGKEGQSYITVKHDLAEDARILVYTALSEYGLENAYPLLVNKGNYLIKKGESVTVTVGTKDSDNTKLRNISYDLEKNDGVIRISEKNKREIAVSAENTGSEVILVRYNGAAVQRVYVSVTEGNYGPNAGYLVTENIIGLLLNTEYTAHVETDIITSVSWKKQDDGIIGISGNYGKSAVISGNIPGKTMLAVRAGDIERHIAVFVCATETELRQYQAINIEQRLYKIRKNDSITVTVHSYQGKVEGRTQYSDYYNYRSPYGNVIEVNAAENNKFSVKGVNEGIAAVRVTNDFYQTEIVVYIEVAAADEGGTGIIDKKHYITAQKTLYVIGMEDRNIMMSADVIGDDFRGGGKWLWYVHKDSDSSKISLSYMGNSAVVNPKGEGAVKIIAHNDDCANDLEITVIVGDRFVIDDSLLPYIYIEKNLYEVMKGSGSFNIPYSIINAGTVNTANVRFSYNNNVQVAHDAVGSSFTVTPLQTGIARIDITYGDLKRDVYVLVKEELSVNNIYLTTSENYVIISVGELRMVNVRMAGYEEVNVNNFIWNNDKSSVVTLAGNGLIGQLYGVSEGDAVITVYHKTKTNRNYPLKINVKVVKDKVKENAAYLTTERNVIEMAANGANELVYVQKIGVTDALTSGYTWGVSDQTVIALDFNGYADGNSAQIIPKKAGMAKITVSGGGCKYPLEIVVIVGPPSNSDVYIGVDSDLIVMTLEKGQVRVTAQLINGDEKDNNKFEWSYYKTQPADPYVAQTGGAVVNMLPSNNECFLTPFNEGITRIRLYHEKANPSSIIITVYVTRYDRINFSVTEKEVVKGDHEFVALNVPTYEEFGNRVRLGVFKEDGASGKDICEASYIRGMVWLQGKQEGYVIVKAWIEGKPEEAMLYVDVVNEAAPEVNRIVASKSLVVMNPKSPPEFIDAVISGANVVDYFNDNIRWELEPGSEQIIKILPGFSDTLGIGRKVQIEPTGQTGIALITVKDGGSAGGGTGIVAGKHTKQIQVIVEEINDAFQILWPEDQVKIVKKMMPETIEAEIIGGTAKDYSEIKWMVKMKQKWDGTMLEVVRVMGSGREVMLYPMNDGTTEVWAFYGDYRKHITVKVESDYYFSFKTGNEYMYPGEPRELPFEVKPPGSNIHWINPSSPDGPVVSFAEVLGSAPDGEGNVTRYLEVQALQEGTTSITGMANGQVGSVNIIVQYDYSLTMITPSFQERAEYHSAPLNIDYNGTREVEYVIYPPTGYILPDPSTVPPGLTVEVLSPEIIKDTRTGRNIGKGKIKFKASREIKKDVKFYLYKERKNGSAGNPEKAKDKENADIYKEIHAEFYFPDVYLEPVPYLIRGDGRFTNQGKGSKKLYNGRTQGQVLGASFGGIDQYGKRLNSDSSYTLVLGDGEAHYLLLDKMIDTAEIVIDPSTSTSSTDTTIKYLKDNYGIDFSATVEEITIENVKHTAIRLSGGEDYIKYNRVMFDKELFMYVKSNGSSSNSNNITSRSEEFYTNVYYAGYDGEIFTIYEYDGKTLLFYEDFGLPFEFIIDDANDVDTDTDDENYNPSVIGGRGWSPGVYGIHNWNYLSDGNGNVVAPKTGNLYTTVIYTVDIPEIETDGNTDETVTKYSVFERKFISPDGSRSATTGGVYITHNAPLDTYQNYNIMYKWSCCSYGFNHWQENWTEYMTYYANIKNAACVTKPNLASTRAIINGRQSPGSNMVIVGYGPTPPHAPAGTPGPPVYGSRTYPENNGVTGNHTGVNIFLPNPNDTEGYSNYYYTGTHYATHKEWPDGSHYRENKDTGSYRTHYTNVKTKQKLVWENTGKIIVPYNIFNMFPFRYETAKGVQTHYSTRDTGYNRFDGNSNFTWADRPDTNIVKISDEGGKPMPSVNITNQVPSDKSFTITISYRRFKDPENTYPKHIEIIVYPQVRQCHSMYTGSSNNETNDNLTRFVGENGAPELMGSQTNEPWYSSGTTVNTKLNMGDLLEKLLK
jgi:hypothetical protein